MRNSKTMTPTSTLRRPADDVCYSKYSQMRANVFVTVVFFPVDDLQSYCNSGLTGTANNKTKDRNMKTENKNYVGLKFSDAAHGGEHVVVSQSLNRFGSVVLRCCKTGTFGGWGTYADYTTDFVEKNQLVSTTATHRVEVSK
jgi:hypothetical protein